MSQVTSGLRATLSSPFIYEIFQKIMGARQGRLDLVEHFIRPEDGFRILDLGCGTAEILSCMPNDVEYYGYDISEKYISAARERFGDRGKFHCGLLGEEDLMNLPKFDLVLAIGVLHHLNDSEAETFFTTAKQVLKFTGRVVTIDPCFAAGQSPVARFLILCDRGQNIRDAIGYAAIAEGVFSSVQGTLRHRSWIPYTHWIMECAG